MVCTTGSYSSYLNARTIECVSFLKAVQNEHLAFHVGAQPFLATQHFFENRKSMAALEVPKVFLINCLGPDICIGIPSLITQYHKYDALKDLEQASGPTASNSAPGVTSNAESNLVLSFHPSCHLFFNVYQNMSLVNVRTPRVAFVFVMLHVRFLLLPLAEYVTTEDMNIMFVFESEAGHEWIVTCS